MYLINACNSCGPSNTAWHAVRPGTALANISGAV
jgi:hypothetical protein